MRAFSLRAGLAAAIVSVSTMSAFAAPAVDELQAEALQNHGLTVTQAPVPAKGKIVIAKKSQGGSKYDLLQREAWRSHQ